MRECDICLDKWKKKHTYKCKNENLVFCYECIQYQTRQSILQWPKCCEEHGYLDHKTMRKALGKKKKKFKKFIVKYDTRFIRSMPGLVFCPKPKCRTGFILDNKCQKRKLKCINEECGFEWCSKCRKKWKKGHKKKCKGKQQIEIQLKKIDKKKRCKSKKCPSCRVMITKIDGCRHMKCKYCSHEFCWECLKNYGNCKYGCPGYED